MKHPWRYHGAPPPAPTEVVTGGELIVNSVAWVLALVLMLALVSCVYHRARSEPPLRAKRIHFSLFRWPHVSLVH